MSERAKDTEKDDVQHLVTKGTIGAALSEARDEVARLDADISRHMQTIHNRDREIEVLRAQNAELLEAVKAADWLRRSAIWNPDGEASEEEYDDTVLRVVRAIAKSKGGVS